MAQTTKKASAKKKAPAKKAVAKKKTPAKKAVAKKETSARKVATSKTPTTKPRASTKRATKPARSPFSKAFLVAQEAVLIKERATYLGQAETLKAEADSLVADVDPGDVQFDEESGEGDSLAIERDRDLALSSQARQAVDEIDHALAKFALGTYGICEVSGDPIPEERLDAIPWARQRVEHKIGGLGRR